MSVERRSCRQINPPVRYKEFDARLVKTKIVNRKTFSRGARLLALTLENESDDLPPNNSAFASSVLACSSPMTPEVIENDVSIEKQSTVLQACYVQPCSTPAVTDGAGDGVAHSIQYESNPVLIDQCTPMVTGKSVDDTGLIHEHSIPMVIRDDNAGITCSVQDEILPAVLPAVIDSTAPMVIDKSADDTSTFQVGSIAMLLKESADAAFQVHDVSSSLTIELSNAMQIDKSAHSDVAIQEHIVPQVIEEGACYTSDLSELMSYSMLLLNNSSDNVIDTCDSVMEFTGPQDDYCHLADRHVSDQSVISVVDHETPNVILGDIDSSNTLLEPYGYGASENGQYCNPPVINNHNDSSTTSQPDINVVPCGDQTHEAIHISVSVTHDKDDNVTANQLCVNLLQTGNENSATSHLNGNVSQPSNETSPNQLTPIEQTSNQNADCTDASSIQQRIGRKRQRNLAEWKQNMRKRLRNSGMEYVRVNGQIRDKRRMLYHVCGQCVNKCTDRMKEDARQSIFENFWAMADHSRQRDYICSHVEQKRVASEGQKASFAYYLTLDQERIQVCKQVFLATLNVGERTVRYAVEHSLGTGKAQDDKRGKHAPGKKKPDEEKQLVMDHISSFPALPSHYARADTNKKYLDSTLSVRKMYSLYSEECAKNGIQPVKECYYRHIFDTCFNLSFHRPKKDYCCFCHAYNSASQEERQKLQDEHNAHLRRKENSRSAKAKFKADASENGELLVATFDLQAVLNSPKLNVSSVYYKRKLSTYNLTVYNLASQASNCYMWHEGLAGRGSSDIASCMLKFLLSLPDSVTRVVLFSDTCGGQNRNQFFSAMVLYALQQTQVQQLDHIYMESGHSQMECDSVHAAIECAVKNMDVYAPTDYYRAVSMARRSNPYKVVMMNQSDFLDFKPLAKHLIRNRNNRSEVSWLKVKHFRYMKSQPNCIYFKYDSDVDNDKFACIQVNQGLRGRRPVVMPDSLPALYTCPVKISAAKYRDLMSLCDTQAIHADYHSFYKSLAFEAGVSECLADTDVEDDVDNA